MTARRADHVVVGAGLLGLTAAWTLRQRGRDVIVLEQAEAGHPGSGSKGGARVFRLGYDDPGYVTLARRARPLWDELAERTGSRLIYPVPQLTFGAGMQAVREAMTAAGAPCELLTASQAAERFPAVITGGQALLEPQSAVIAADRVLRVLAAGLPAVRQGVRVTGLADDGRQVTVRTGAGDITAASVIVCAGPATSELLATGGLAVPPAAATLEQVAYLATAGDQQPELPIFICYEGQAPYGLPVPGSAVCKIGIHPSGPPAGPGWQQHLAADPVLTSRLDQVARRFLPSLNPQPLSTERCVYDNSPDEDFIIDRLGNVVIGCGTSGHGFKFGPLLGRWLANLAAGDHRDLPGGEFRLRRFSS